MLDFLRVSADELLFLGLCGVSRAADLTDTELRRLRGIWPVIADARQSRLALDIVVQPPPAPGASPLAMAFVDGRCKLVLSLRGNDQAQAAFDRIEPQLLAPALELMAAHDWATAAATSMAAGMKGRRAMRFRSLRCSALRWGRSIRQCRPPAAKRLTPIWRAWPGPGTTIHGNTQKCMPGSLPSARET